MAANEKDIDRLYGLPLAEFTAERDALAKRLRKDGDRDAADEVKRLKKPSEPAWAVNQLARGNKREVNALLKAGERLRDAQTGGAGRDELRAAIAAEREHVAKLTTLAQQLLKSASETKLERVRNTLHAAAVDEDTRELIGAGRLVADAEAVGLGLPGVAAPKRESKAQPMPKQRGRARTEPSVVDERKVLRAIEAARKREREAREKADRARTELKHARAAAEDATKALQTAERRVKEAEARESDAQDRLAEAEAGRAR